MASEQEGRIVGVVGTCSAGGCSRPAARYIELDTAHGPLVGVVCERCAQATSAALFVLTLIA